MPDSTAKSEAMQAIRLLYRYAVKHQGAEHETLYRARRLLEEFIEGKSMPDLSIAPTAEYDGSETLIRHFQGVRFKIGEWIFIEFEGRIGQIWYLNADSITTRTQDGPRVVIAYEDAVKLNSLGSFTDNGER